MKHRVENSTRQKHMHPQLYSLRPRVELHALPTAIVSRAKFAYYEGNKGEGKHPSLFLLEILRANKNFMLG